MGVNLSISVRQTVKELLVPISATRKGVIDFTVQYFEVCRFIWARQTVKELAFPIPETMRDVIGLNVKYLGA